MEMRIGAAIVGAIMWAALTACGGPKALGEETTMETMVSFRTKELDVATLRALVDDAAFAKVMSLDIAKHPLGAEALAVLATSPNAAGLRSLNARQIAAGDAGAKALAGSASVGVETLYLGDNGITPAGVQSLLASELASKLEILHLDQNPLGNEGAMALGSATRLARLKYLDLTSTGVGDEGVKALVASPRLGALEELVLTFNDVTPAAFEGLLSPTALPALRVLTVSQGSLDKVTLHKLANARPGLTVELAP